MRFPSGACCPAGGPFPSKVSTPQASPRSAKRWIAVERSGIGAVWPWFLALVADAARRLGQFDDGFPALDEGEQWVQRNDERLYSAEVHRIRGELLLAQQVPDPARPRSASSRR